jgi:hypothetical protein
MRVAVFVVFVACVPVLATPSEASRSCMTKTEARQHFGSVHLYWHGAGHCWDATSTRRHHRVHKVQRKNNPPKWRESMSKMLPDEKMLRDEKTLPDEEPVQKTWGDRWVDIESPPIVSRWVNIAQVTPPSVIEPKSEPMVTLRGVMMVIIAITLTLAIVEFLSIGMRLAGYTHRQR